MPDKPKFSKEEFLRRERDILKKHRMPTDMNMDFKELMGIMPRNNGNGEMDITGMV